MLGHRRDRKDTPARDFWNDGVRGSYDGAGSARTQHNPAEAVALESTGTSELSRTTATAMGSPALRKGREAQGGAACCGERWLAAPRQDSPSHSCSPWHPGLQGYLVSDACL